MSEPQTDIFVSYSRAHGALVAPLVKLLKLDNRKVFLDEMSIGPGDKWEAVLLDALSEARIVVVLWCSHAQRSPWVSREWELAAKLKKSIIPVLLDGTSLPQELGKFQAINFSGVHPCVGLLAKIKKRFIQVFVILLITMLMLLLYSYLSYSVRHHRFPSVYGDDPNGGLSVNWTPFGPIEAVFLLLFFLFLVSSFVSTVSTIIGWCIRRLRVNVVGRNLAKKVMEQIPPGDGVIWGSLNQST
jgi:TIR domain